MPVPAAAIAMGAGSVISSFIGNAGRRRAEKRARKFDLEMWNLQNEYNHPSAQMARLREAGLNPNLIYGTSPSSAVGNADKVSGARAEDFRFENPLMGLLMHADLEQKNAQTNNLKTQNDLIIAETALKGVQAGETLARTAKTRLDYQIASELKQTSIDAQKEALRKLELTSIGQELENEFKSKAMQDQLKQLFYQASYAKDNLEGVQLDNIMKKLDIELKKLGIEKGDPWYFRILGREITNPSSIFKN